MAHIIPVMSTIAGGEDDDTLARALKKAIESGDTDLVYLVLFAAYRAKPLPDFWALVGSRMLARNLFVKYARAKVCGVGVRSQVERRVFRGHPGHRLLLRWHHSGCEV